LIETDQEDEFCYQLENSIHMTVDTFYGVIVFRSFRVFV